ncbi:MAG: hypothetical protein K6T86_21855 [Pirellulales bacterium]|nr:hypothetical protein [Pirellulales bacterium]
MWAVSVVALAHLAWGVEEEQPAAASGKKEVSANKPRRRLPPFYSRVINNMQREAIYAIQDEYAPRIDELEDQLEALIAERDAKIEAVLTPEQLEQVKQLATEAQQRRKRRSSGTKAPAESGTQGDRGGAGNEASSEDSTSGPATPEKDNEK